MNPKDECGAQVVVVPSDELLTVIKIGPERRRIELRVVGKSELQVWKRTLRLRHLRAEPLKGLCFPLRMKKIAPCHEASCEPLRLNKPKVREKWLNATQIIESCIKLSRNGGGRSYGMGGSDIYRESQKSQLAVRLRKERTEPNGSTKKKEVGAFGQDGLWNFLQKVSRGFDVVLVQMNVCDSMNTGRREIVRSYIRLCNPL
jgi:hypothetical protein